MQRTERSRLSLESTARTALRPIVNGVVAVTTNSRAEYGRIWQTWLRGLGQPDSYRCPGSRLDYSGLLVRIL